MPSQISLANLSSYRQRYEPETGLHYCRKHAPSQSAPVGEHSTLQTNSSVTWLMLRRRNPSISVTKLIIPPSAAPPSITTRVAKCYSIPTRTQRRSVSCRLVSPRWSRVGAVVCLGPSAVRRLDAEGRRLRTRPVRIGRRQDALPPDWSPLGKPRARGRRSAR